MDSRLQLTGAMTAIVTPFKNGQVDYDALGKLIEAQIAGGIQALVPCGTTGESPTLSHDEHDKVIEFTIDKVAGRVPVIAGTGSNSTEEALRLTKHAKKVGADACLIVNPYYNKPTQEGMYQHIAKIAEADLPIVLYNIPGRTGVEMSADTIAKLYNDFPQVVAVKEATGKLDLASEIASKCDITILSGDDSLTLPLYAVGGKGVISVLANIMPDQIRKLTDLSQAGEMEKARELHLKLYPLFKNMFVETNPIPVKAAMSMLGMCENELRLPMHPLSDQYRPMIADLLKQFGFEL